MSACPPTHPSVPNRSSHFHGSYAADFRYTPQFELSDREYAKVKLKCAHRIRTNGEKSAHSKSKTMRPINVVVLRRNIIELILGLLTKFQPDLCIHGGIIGFDPKPETRKLEPCPHIFYPPFSWDVAHKCTDFLVIFRKVPNMCLLQDNYLLPIIILTQWLFRQ